MIIILSSLFHQAPALVLELPRVSSSSSDPHSSCILSPSHGFTNPPAGRLPLLLLPNANSSVAQSDMWTSLGSGPPGMVGEHIPLWPGVHILEDPSLAIPPLWNLNGLDETRLKVGDEGPPLESWSPASHPGSEMIWWPGLAGVEDGRKV